MERYYAKPWMKAVASSQSIFTQAYYLRRRSSPRAVAVGEMMAHGLGPRRYALCWVRHKVTRPFDNLWRWTRKQRGLD